MSTATDPYRQLSDAIHRDLGAAIEPIGDGKIHRFSDPDGGPRNGACWYVFHVEGFPAGAYGNWRTGFSTTWRLDPGRPLTDLERERARRATQEALRQREVQRARDHARAQEQAQTLWDAAEDAHDDHPYLAAKRISAYGLRESRGVLLVPLQTVEGELVNLQSIRSDGAKRFLKGGLVKGAFSLIGATEVPERGSLYIAEGYATATSIAGATERPVVAAMTAGNLRPVAEAIRAVRPHLELVIAADNDWRTEGNPGLTMAREAAEAAQAALTWPEVCATPNCQCTDFNDAMRCERAPCERSCAPG